MSIEQLKNEIRVLQKALARNGFELRMEKRSNRILDLMSARMEIYKSIAHRQGIIIEIQANIIKFEWRKAA